MRSYKRIQGLKYSWISAVHRQLTVVPFSVHSLQDHVCLPLVCVQCVGFSISFQFYLLIFCLMCAVRFCSRVSQFFSQVFPLCPDFPAFYLFCSLPACCCHITLLWSFFYISQCLLGTLSFNYFVLLTFPFLFCQLISSIKGSPFAQLPLTFCVCIFGPCSPHSNTSRLNHSAEMCYIKSF